MPRGIYARNHIRVIETVDDTDGMTKEELKDRLAKANDSLAMAIQERDIARSDAGLLETRCDLYERLLDHITPKRQAE